MEKIKKVLCLFLAFVMVFGLLPVSSVVAEPAAYTLYDGQTFRSKIKDSTTRITFHAQTDVPASEDAFALSEDGNIIGIYSGEELDIYSSGVIKANSDASYMFSELEYLETLELSGLDTSDVTSMHLMFAYCSALKTLDLSSFDTSHVTLMSYMFCGCSALETLDLSNFDTSKVTWMSWMFCGCSALETLDLSSFNTSNVTDMNEMFSNCNTLKALDLSNFDTSNVTDMGYMFYGCANLEALNLSSFDTSNVTWMACMFAYCSALETLNVSGFDTSNVTKMGGMFNNCSALKTLDLSSFDTSNVTNMGQMFYYCRCLETLNVSGFDTSHVTYMGYMFRDCSALEILDVSNFDTSNVTNMCQMFFDCRALEVLDVSNFDTSNVTKMCTMFWGCNSLKTLDVSGFDTSNVTDMSSMFYNCSALETLDVSGFDTSNVTDMSSMFCGCCSLNTLNVSGFDTSNVTNMEAMFSSCYALNALDVSNFDTSNVTNIGWMFCGCSSLKKLDLSSFDTSKAEDSCDWMLDFCGYDEEFACEELVLGDKFTITGEAAHLSGDNWYLGTQKVETSEITGPGTFTRIPDESSIELTISDTAINLLAGTAQTLTATASDESAVITWTSSAPSVASVSDTGKVTAKKAGIATITATAETDSDIVTASCDVNVKSSVTPKFTQTHTVSDYTTENNSYRSEYNYVIGRPMDGSNSTPDLCIPGLSEDEHMIPQGMTYWAAKNYILISAYDSTEEAALKCPSVIFALDADTGKLVGQYSIYNADLTPNTTHVGGIAATENNLYITCGSNKIGYVPLSQLEENSSVLVIKDTMEVSSLDAATSYLSYGDGCIWTGNFFKENTKYDTPANSSYNSLILGYKISGSSSEAEWKAVKNAAPAYTLQVPEDIDRIQCATVSGGKVYINQSYTRSADSTLLIGSVNLSSSVITLSESSMQSFTTLPMGEGIFVKDGYLYTLNESAAYSYYDEDEWFGNSKNPTDVIWRASLTSHLIKPSVTIKSTATIYTGKTKTLTATTVPANRTLTWKSSKTSVAKVSKGVVTAVKAGTATITASFSYNGKTYSDTCKVTVKDPTISLNASSTSITKGLTKTLKATVAGPSSTVTWTTSDKSIAKVSSSGVVTAVATGSCTITAKANGVKATCKVTVKAPTTKLSASSLTIANGKTKTLTATVTGANKSATWTSSDRSVATVSSNGVVTAKGLGTCTITATANGVKATCKVTVEKCYTITYNLNGGTNNSANPSYYTKSSGTITLKNPTKTGYTFAGWYTSSKLTGTKVTKIKGSDLKNYKLYAKWTANTYTIKFNANGGTGSMSSVKGTYNKSLTLPKNTFTHSTLYFDCWNTKADGTGTSYSNGKSVKNLAASGTVTLYAQWREAKYNIVYDNNTDFSDYVVKSKYTDTVYTDADYTIKSMDELGLYKASGSVFKEWNTAADGSGTAYTSGQTVNGLAQTEGATVTLYAQYYADSRFIRASDKIQVYSQWDGYMYKDACTVAGKDADWLLTSGCSYFAICHALQWLGLTGRDSETVGVENLPIKLVNLTAKASTNIGSNVSMITTALSADNYAKAMELNVDIEHFAYNTTPECSLTEILAMNGVAFVTKYRHWYLAVDISPDGNYVHIVDSCLCVPDQNEVTTYRFDTETLQFVPLAGDYSTVAAKSEIYHYCTYKLDANKNIIYDSDGNPLLTTGGPMNAPNAEYAGGDYWVEYNELADATIVSCYNTLTKTELG